MQQHQDDFMRWVGKVRELLGMKSIDEDDFSALFFDRPDVKTTSDLGRFPGKPQAIKARAGLLWVFFQVLMPAQDIISIDGHIQGIRNPLFIAGVENVRSRSR